jgi:hypothetical protein
MKNIYPNKDEKIIQIMPAPNDLFAEFANDDDPDNPFISRVICLALTDAGEIYLMDIDENGWIDKAESMNNFQGVKWGNK